MMALLSSILALLSNTLYELIEREILADGDSGVGYSTDSFLFGCCEDGYAYKYVISVIGLMNIVRYPGCGVS